jgi:predicted dehydrogenase
MTERESRVLGVGVVGLGVGEQHARAFAAHPDCSVRALHDIDGARAERLAGEIGARTASSFEEMLDSRDIDVVSLASYDDAHFDQVMAALAAGKHVFVEKPICRTLDELRRIKERWQSAGGKLKLRSNLVLRGAPLYRWLRGQIESGAFGSLYAFDGDYLYGRLHKITEGWRRDVGDYSVMEGGGIHVLDLLLWLTGERPVAVTATGNRICSRGTDFRFNDFAAATLEFDGGLVARISANFGCVHRHQHVVRVFGTEATLIYDDAGPRLHRSRDPAQGAERLGHDALPPGKGALIPDFVTAILEDASDAGETQSFFDGISICVAADRAAGSGKREGITYV